MRDEPRSISRLNHSPAQVSINPTFLLAIGSSLNDVRFEKVQVIQLKNYIPTSSIRRLQYATEKEERQGIRQAQFNQPKNIHETKKAKGNLAPRRTPRKINVLGRETNAIVNVCKRCLIPHKQNANISKHSTPSSAGPPRISGIECIVIASRLFAVFDVVVRLRKGAADIMGVVPLGPLARKD